MDYAHKQTDKMLARTERRISREYKQAEKEVAQKLNAYLASFRAKDKLWEQWVKGGKKTQEEWNNWRTGQMAMGQRWEDMRQSLAEDMHHTNEIAGSIVNGHIPDVYALNHNYGTYEIESGLGIDTSYTLYDRQTVERLMRDNPQMLPPPGKRVSARIRDGLDVKWNEKVIQSAMMQSILQGESIGQIATRLATAVCDSDRVAALRNARTMTTGAQNAGRIDSYERAQDMGIKMKQQWVATLDGRTRHEHRMLDGETVEVGEPWEINGDEIRFPGDPAAPGYLVYNCRCTVIAALEGFERDLSDLSIRYADKLNGMSYEEWMNEKGRKR